MCALSAEQKSWDKKVFPAHKGGANALSWGPDVKTGALLALNAQGTAAAADQKAAAQAQAAIKVSRRFVTAGCDNRIKIWRCVPSPLTTHHSTPSLSPLYLSLSLA
jgi:protein transport protein SEC13